MSKVEQLREAFHRCARPVTIGELVDMVEPKPAYSSAYRVVRALVKEKAAIEVRESDSRVTYVPAPPEHSTLRCPKCGLAVTFDAEELQVAQEKILAQLAHELGMGGPFKVLRRRYELTVACPEGADGKCQPRG